MNTRACCLVREREAGGSSAGDALFRRLRREKKGACFRKGGSERFGLTMRATNETAA